MPRSSSEGTGTAELLILGAGGHACVVAETAVATGRWTPVFLDDRYPTLDHVLGWPVIGTTAAVGTLGERFPDVFVAIGDNAIRMKFLTGLYDAGRRLPALIHPSAWVGPSVRVGGGTVIMAQAAVNAAAVIGRGCIVNTGATVDHECSLEDGVHVSPGAHLGGRVRVGTRTWIGIGASVRQDTSIGADVIVGAGAAVVSSLPDHVTALGVPARIR